MRLILAALAGCASDTMPCGADEQCVVDDGDYMAWAPPDWNGRDTLPVVVWFHGHGGRADGGGADSLREAAGDLGALVLAPQGGADTWNVTNVEGFSASQRDELAFMDTVLADAEARFPLDPDRRLATGFSQGSSVAALLACHRADDWTAAVPISGTFWVPHPEACTGPARPVRHVHGDIDRVWPRDGRPIGPAQQGAVDDSVALWRAHHRCTDASETFDDGPLTCTRWTDCASGEVVEDCRHAGGHGAQGGWASRLVDWWDAQP